MCKALLRSPEKAIHNFGNIYCSSNFSHRICNIGQLQLINGLFHFFLCVCLVSFLYYIEKIINTYKKTIIGVIAVAPLVTPCGRGKTCQVTAGDDVISKPVRRSCGLLVLVFMLIFSYTI